jgi:hypothetical protein
MLVAAFLVRKRWCMAFFWFHESSKVLLTVTMRSEIKKAPQKAAIMIITRPM